MQMQRISLALVAGSLLIASVFIGGINSANRAYAHTFAGDESAAFLAKVQELKVETRLIQQDLSNKSLVAWHTDKISEFWNVNDTKEMNERNMRLATDIPATISNITAVANSTSPDSSKIGQLLTSLDNDLGEAVTVRIEPTQLSNTTVNGLAIVAVLDEMMEDYGIATGAEEGPANDTTESAHGTASAASSSNMSAASSNSSSSGTNETSGKVVNFAAYQLAQGLGAAAQNMYNSLKPKAMPNSTSQIAALDAAFAKLKKAFDDKMPNDAMQSIVEKDIHPNLAAFGVKEQGEEKDGGANPGNNNTNSTVSFAIV
jgi:hypothetical protein